MKKEKEKIIVKYRLLIDTVRDDDGNQHTVYGIQSVSSDETVVLSISDISFDSQKAQVFVDLCNSLELSIIHFYDVLDDFLAE